VPYDTPRTGSTRPVDSGAAHPVDAGSPRPLDAGSTHPVDIGSTHPVDVGSTHPVDVDGVRERVSAVLEEFLDRQAGTVHGVAPDCDPLLDVIRDLVRGGKRLRPAFCYWGWRAAGGADGPEIVRAAAALELFQAAALIHDDVMDGSDTRRGMPAVHRRFAALHTASGWRGGSEGFGTAGAVLAGDLCLVWSGELFHGCGLTPHALARAREPFDRMRTELMAGQYLDMLEQVVAEQPPDEQVERARRVIRFKSAKYSVQEPLLIGAALAGAPTPVLDGFAELGLLLGEAFQLRDDILGVFGDPELTGKPAGDDLREGKRTVLVALARATADPAQTALLTRGVGDPELDAEGVARLRDVIVATGALTTVESLIDDLAARTRTVLAGLDLAAGADAVLDSLIEASTARSS
jgi:geranylgeranyl diphosphate synthase, type I